MATEAASLAVKITADISGLISGTNKAGSSLRRFGSKVRSGATDFAKYGAAATAAGAAIATALVRRSMSAIDAQAKLAQQLRTTSSSLATLTRAGELAGVEMRKIETAGRTLDVALGKAAQGEKTYAEALGKLGLSAEYLASLPLDQRINEINQALAQNVTEAERAAVAADLFGARNASAIQQLNPQVLAEAARQAELFGRALSDVDAAKVEMANDSLSTIRNAFDGFVEQFTVQLAPILKAVGDQFLKAAEEAGGMGNIAKDAFNLLIKGAGFAMDAVEGLKRVFSVAADTLIATFSKAIGFVITGMDTILLGWQKIAELMGADFAAGGIQSIRDFGAQSEQIAAEALANIQETLNAPMPSAGLQQFAADAIAAGEAAAQAAVAARESVGPAATMMTPEEREAEIDALIDHAHRKLEIEREAEEERTRLAKLEADNRKTVTGKILGQTTALMNSENRKMFEIGKAAAYSQALINTAQGISEAWKLGPILGPPMAALVALNGFAQVKNIKKQQFGGGGAASGGGAAGGAAGSNTQNINAGNQPVSEPRQLVNLTFVGDGFSRGQVEDMANQLVSLRNDGAQF